MCRDSPSTRPQVFDPEDARLYTNRGTARRRIAEERESAEELWHAIAEDGGTAVSKAKAALSAAQTGKSGEQTHVWSAIIKGRLLRGVALCRLGEFAEGTACLRTAIDDARHVSGKGNADLVGSITRELWECQRAAKEAASAASASAAAMDDDPDALLSQLEGNALLRDVLCDSLGWDARRLGDAVARLRSGRASDAREDEVGVPEWATCPITLDLMTDPVLAPSGHSFDRAAIDEYLRLRVERGLALEDPVTRERIHQSDLVLNRALKQAIDEWVELHPMSAVA
jgi:hypothetical protein